MKNLSELVTPYDVNKFVAKIQKGNSFLIKGRAKRYSGLFDLDKFYSAIQYGEKEKPMGYRISKLIPTTDESLQTTTSEAIMVHDVGATIDEGNTICVTHIELCDDDLFNIAASLKNELHYTGNVQVNCYLSPEGSGANLHFDSSLGMTLQIEGKKVWRYANAPAIEAPRSTAQVNSNGEPLWVLPFAGHEAWEKLDRVNPEDLKEVVLSRGDLLCLPAGVWHMARAVGYSLALNFFFKPLDYCSLMLKLIYDHFQPDPAWRGGPPPFAGDLKDIKTNKQLIKHWNERWHSLDGFLAELEKNPTFFSQLYDQQL